jgi:hypothetical protein
VSLARRSSHETSIEMGVEVGWGWGEEVEGSDMVTHSVTHSRTHSLDTLLCSSYNATRKKSGKAMRGNRTRPYNTDIHTVEWSAM